MHFPALLTALFIDQVIWNGPAHRHFHWLRDYLAWWFSQPLSRPAQDSGWAALVPLLPLVLVLGWLQFGLIQAAGPFPGYAFGALVLLFSLGPEDASRDVSAFLRAMEKGDLDSAQRLLDAPAGHGDWESLPERMSERLLITICRGYIGPVFWFALAGPVGAASYRLAEQAGRFLNDRHATGIRQDRLFPLLDWIPVRLTAAGFAIAGNFDAVAAAWRQCSRNEGNCPSDGDLLLATGQAALENSPARSRVERIEDTLALGWRNLTLWVVIMGIAWLLSLL